MIVGKMENNIKVAVRMRPLVEEELSKVLPTYWQIDDHTIYQIMDSKGVFPLEPQSFAFDNLFNDDQNNNQIFETVVQPMVMFSMRGYNSTVFTYGQTASGKTHTMLGNETDPGIIPRTIEHIFETINNDPEHQFLLRISYIDIYNNSIRDLLDECPKEIEIYEDSSGTIHVKNIKETVICTRQQGHHVIKDGEKRRKYGATDENHSKSHTILKIIIESSLVNDYPNLNLPVHVSHLNLVDLAGSQINAKLQLGEEDHNNQSLETFTKVIRQLSSGDYFISFYESQLTRILKESLGGNAKTLIIGTISPTFFEESVSTLQIMSQAQMIRNKAMVNKVLDSETHKYMKEGENLTWQLEETIKNNQDVEDKHTETATDLWKKLHQLTENFITSNRASLKQERSQHQALGISTVQEEILFKETLNIQQIMELDRHDKLNNPPVSIWKEDKNKRLKFFDSLSLLENLEGKVEKHVTTHLLTDFREMYETLCNVQAELEKYKRKIAEASNLETRGQTHMLDMETEDESDQNSNVAEESDQNSNVCKESHENSNVAKEFVNTNSEEAELASLSSYEDRKHQDNDQSGIFLHYSEIDHPVTSAIDTITDVQNILTGLRSLLLTVTVDHSQTDCEEYGRICEEKNEKMVVDIKNCRADLIKIMNETDILQNVNKDLLKKQEQFMAVLIEQENVNLKLKSECLDFTVKIAEQKQANTILLEQRNTFQSKLSKLCDDSKQLAVDVECIKSNFSEKTKKNSDLTREKFQLTRRMAELEAFTKLLANEISELQSTTTKQEQNNTNLAKAVKSLESKFNNEICLAGELIINKSRMRDKITDQENSNKLLQNELVELVQVNAMAVKEFNVLQSKFDHQRELSSKIKKDIALLRDAFTVTEDAYAYFEQQKQALQCEIAEKEKLSLSIRQELFALEEKLTNKREVTIQLNGEKTELQTAAKLKQEVTTKLGLMNKKQMAESSNTNANITKRQKEKSQLKMISNVFNRQLIIKENIPNGGDDHSANEMNTFHFKNTRSLYRDEASSSENDFNNTHLPWKIDIQHLQDDIKHLDNKIIMMSKYMKDLEKTIRQKSKKINEIKSQHDAIAEVKRRRSSIHDSSRNLEWLQGDEEDEDDPSGCSRCSILNSKELNQALHRELERKNIELTKLQKHLDTMQLDLSVKTTNNEKMSEHIKHLERIIDNQREEKNMQDF